MSPSAAPASIAFAAIGTILQDESRGAPMTIESPCTKVCTVDPCSGLCLGCGRTLAEIADWTALSAAERAAIMATLPRRLAARAAACPA